MKLPRWILIVVLLASLALIVVACGDDSAPEPEPTDVVQAPTDTPIPPTDTPVPPTDTPIPPTDTPVPPTDTPVPPTDTPEPIDEPEIDLDLSEVVQTTEMTSYRSHVIMSVEGTENGEPVTQSFDFLTEFTSDPPAQHVIISAEGMEEMEEFNDIEMYVIEDTMYIRLGEQWMNMPAEGDPLADMEMFSTNEILEDTCGWQRQKDTEVNGIEAHHWTISREDLEACATSEQLEELGNITAVSGELYIAVDDNYIVKLDMTLEGEDMDSVLGQQGEENGLDQATIRISMEMLDVNEPFTITLPEEAVSGSGVPDDIPVPEDAEEISSLMGFITFQSASSPEELTEFYQAQMPNNGWAEVSVDEMAGMFILEYEKDGKKASLMITPDTDTGKTSVLITVEEG